MAPGRPSSSSGSGADERVGSPSGGPSFVGLGPALRRAWLGYQLRLDAAMAEAGFGERRFPDGRVLRLCSGASGSTISAIGRELGITRQGASKVVARLCDRGYVTIADSATSKREKSVALTPRGRDYLRVQRKKVKEMEDELRTTLGDDAFHALFALLDALSQGETPRLRAYLQRSAGGGS
jgi:DNA-binding MarR family transcriptional regulator